MRYKKAFDDPSGGNGVRVALAGFLLDGVLDDGIAKQFVGIKRKFELIARQADKLTPGETSFVDNVDLAVQSYVLRVQNFLRFNDRQIQALRDVLSGQSTDLANTASAVNPSFAANSMAILGGADVNPQTNEPSRGEDGSYFVDAVAGLGLLYTGSKVLNIFGQDYFDEFGDSPSFRWTWVHTTPPNRELHAHGELGGESYTLAERPIVLANTSVPWLGPIFFPFDHYGCNCIEIPSLL